MKSLRLSSMFEDGNSVQHHVLSVILFGVTMVLWKTWQQKQQQQQQQQQRLHDSKKKYYFHNNYKNNKNKMLSSQDSGNSSNGGFSRTAALRRLSLLRKWERYNADMETWVQDLPKVELHVHLDGAFDPNLLWKFLQSHDNALMCLPTSTVLPWKPPSEPPLPVRSLVSDCKTACDYHALCTCRGRHSLYDMLQCFEMFLPLVRKHYDELLEELAYDFCRRQAEQHAIYTEVRYSPQLLTPTSTLAVEKDNNNIEMAKQDAWKALHAVTKGLRRGCHDFEITVNQILCGINWRPDWADQVLDMAVRHAKDYPCAVVAVDVAAGEEHYTNPQYSHKAMIRKAHKLGLNVTIHAGETGPMSAKHVQMAITEYGATRIGHGYSMVDRPELLKLAASKQIHVEICPTSSVETGGWFRYRGGNWYEHPCTVMDEHGVRFSFSSDDPAVFNTSLAWQYRIALGKMGFSQDRVRDTILHAIDAAFCSEQEKQRLRDIVMDYDVGKGYTSSRSTSFNDRVSEDGEE